MRYARSVPLGLLMLLAFAAAGALVAPWSGVQAQVDSDGDGYDDALEAYLGTDPLDDCPDDPSDAAWPPDMNNDTVVNIFDVLYYLPPNPAVGLLHTDPEWNASVQRLDLSGDGAVSAVSDLWYYMVGAYTDTCAGGPPPPPTFPEGDPVTMGIDPETTNNSANTLGDLESCVRVDVAPANMGDGVADHTIDVYVTGDTAAPAGYDAWVTYDPDQVDPVSWDALIKLPGATNVTIKKTSRLNAAALYTSGGPGTPGDGTITRIELDAISAGPACFAFGYTKAYSSAGETHTTIPQAAMAAINEDCPTQDSDGDDVFDVCDNCLNDVNRGQEDFDGDGAGDACDNCPDTANAGQQDTDGDTIGNACDICPADFDPGQDDTDGDGWGDACDYCPLTSTPWFVPEGDSDCDGFTDAGEVFAGTDPADACPDDPGDDAWPSDLADLFGYGAGHHDGVTNIFDINELTPPYFNKCDPDPLYTARKDFSGLTEYVPDGCINIFDITLLTPPMFGKSCTP